MPRSPCRGFLSTTIGRKYLVAITAIFWSVFVMMHMLGNMLIFVSPQVYNQYSHALTSNPLIYGAEGLLLFFIVVHIFVALGLKARNFRTNPKLYAVRPVAEKSAPVSSLTMAYSGTAVLAFIIWHLATFKYGTTYTIDYNGTSMRDLHRLVLEKFHDPFYVVLYSLAMVLLGSHLYHGVKSIFQTLGINHPRYNGFFRYFGYTYAIVVAVGFLSQPIYVYCTR